MPITEKASSDPKRIANLPRGEKHWYSKLTIDDVRAIRKLHTVHGFNKEISLRDTARKFNVSVGAVFKVVNRITWAHVDELQEKEIKAQREMLHLHYVSLERES